MCNCVRVHRWSRAGRFPVYILTAEKRDPGNGNQDSRVPVMETSCLVGYETDLEGSEVISQSSGLTVKLAQVSA